ncbi:MAG: hypothetical protein RL557_732 [archaeon]
MKIKIICTIGPTSNNPFIFERLKDRGVNFFRINLSHTSEEDIEKRIKDILGCGIPIILDTEGSQVRSGNLQEIMLEENALVTLHNSKIECDSHNLFLTPMGIFSKLNEGDLISIDFNSVLLRLFDISRKNEGIIKCKVVIGGLIGGRKAVQVQNPFFQLAPFSNKDHKAVELAKKYGIKHFTLSFMESSESVLKFRENYPEAVIYSKIESKKGLDNFEEIMKVSDGILIDRGDLSSQINLEKIPFIQKYLIQKARELGKEVFIATNTLEQMAFALKPSKAEVNDIINTLLDGATGIALTKETATGRYPVETVNMLNSIIEQFQYVTKGEGENLIKKIENSLYIHSEKVPEMLNKPHGNILINRLNYKKTPQKVIEITEEQLMDVEQIAIGVFSPLEGFLGKKDFDSVVKNMRLSNGIIWPIPLLLDVDETTVRTLNAGEEIGLSYNNELYAILHIEEIYQVHKKDSALSIFGTVDVSHPGAKLFLEMKDYFLGGKVTLVKRRNSPYKMHELTPYQTRKIFAERGWKKIVGFHTRNAIHKSHEFIQLEGMRKSFADGLFVHPVIGKKKQGDFKTEIIIESYEIMAEKFYPQSKVVFGTLATYSRYAGPREALLTALIRKNFGCSHFIVGRDHTGVGNFYDAYASHKIFDQFSKEELGIEIIKFDNVFYSKVEERYIHEPEFMIHPEEDKFHISGTEARKIFLSGQQPPAWFMRPEISSMILKKINQGLKVFVE